MAKETQKGRFTPRNPKKYVGDPTNIWYRSSWELKVMKYLDNNKNVLEWRSEELFIPYISPKDNRWHRYFPDFLVKVMSKDNMTKTLMLEIKPEYQTHEPKKQNKMTRKYITEVVTWGVNQAKWKAAQEYCIDKGWEFRIITENQLGLNK